MIGRFDFSASLREASLRRIISERQREQGTLKDLKNLTVWEKSHHLALSVYKVANSFPIDERYGLTSRLRRADVSIPTNIAEGYGRGADAEFALFPVPEGSGSVAPNEAEREIPEPGTICTRQVGYSDSGYLGPATETLIARSGSSATALLSKGTGCPLRKWALYGWTLYGWMATAVGRSKKNRCPVPTSMRQLCRSREDRNLNPFRRRPFTRHKNRSTNDRLVYFLIVFSLRLCESSLPPS